MLTEQNGKFFELNPQFEQAVYIFDEEKIKNFCKQYKETQGNIGFDIDRLVGILPALYFSAYNKKWNIVRDLLDAGASIDIITTAHKEDFLATLIRLKEVPKDIFESVLEKKLENGNFSFKNPQGLNYLMLAIELNNIKMFEEIYKKEVIPASAIDHEHNHLLHYLAKGGPSYADYFLDVANKEKALIGRFNRANESAFDFLKDEVFKNTFSDMMSILERQEKQKKEKAAKIENLVKAEEEKLQEDRPIVNIIGDFIHPSIQKVQRVRM